MKRRQRTRILVEGNPDLAKQLAHEVRQLHEIHIIKNPEAGLVMICARDSARRQRFYLGEYLVTEALVRIGNTLGKGLTAGNKPDLALDLAVIDAAFEAELDLVATWIGFLVAEEERLNNLEKESALAIARTRVEFSSMEEPL